MKAAMYVDHFLSNEADLESKKLKLFNELHEEAMQLAQKRSGKKAISGFSTVLFDCIEEQVRKYAAICRRLPDLRLCEIEAYYIKRFPKMYESLHERHSFRFLISI